MAKNYWRKVIRLWFFLSYLIPYYSHLSNTVKDTPKLSDLKGPGISKLDWRYFEYNKIFSNELQVRIYLHKGTGTKMTDKLTNFFLCL